MVIVAFPPGEKYAVNYTTLDQYDYGQLLRIQGLKLPKTVEVHFSTQETGGTSITRVGVTKDGVTDVLIPDSVLENGDTTQNYSIFAFIYVTDTTSGKTEYRAKLEVKARPKPEVPGGGDNPDIFHEAVLEVRKSAEKAEEAQRQAEGWAHGREDLPERAEDNAMYYAGKASEDAEKTATDRTEVERLTESSAQIQGEVAKDLEEVKNLSSQAQTSATNAALSEQKSEEAATRAETAQTGAERAEDNAELAAQKTGQDKTAVEQTKKLVQQIGQEVLDNKNAVDKTAQDFTLKAQQALADVNNAGQVQTERVQTAGTTAVENIKTAQNTATQAVETAKSEATKAVQTEGTTQTGAVTAEGEKQVQAVQTAAQEIITDREQIAKNKTDIADLRQKKADAIVETVSGTLLNVKDSAYAFFEDFSMSGKTTQDGTPAPDMPVPIVNAGENGNIEIKVTGKNLIPFPYPLLGGVGTKGTKNGITWEVLKDRGIKIHGKATDYVYVDLLIDEEMQDKEKYAYSKDLLSDTRNGKIFYAPYTTETIDELYYPQVEHGTIATAYEPYRQPQTITLQLDRPLTKWDRLEKREGVWGVARQGDRKILDGTENWYEYTTYDNEMLHCYFIESIKAESGFKKSFCTHFINTDSAWLNEIGKYGTYSDHKTLPNKYFVIDKPTIEEFKAWLTQQKEAGTPVELVYKTAEETWEPLPEEMQKILNALHTNYPTTVVSNSEETEMELSYIADTKNYCLNREQTIQKQILEIQNALISQKISGGGIKVTNSAKLPIVKLSVFGKSEQNGVPTVENPIPMVSAGESGNIEVKITGKNLINVSEDAISSSYDAGSYTIKNGVIAFNTANNWGGDYLYFNDIDVSINKEIVLQMEATLPEKQDTETNGAKILFKAYNKLGEEIKDSESAISNDTWKMAYNDHYKGLAYYRRGSNISIKFSNTVVKIKIGVAFLDEIAGKPVIIRDYQVEYGTTPTAYGPYKEQTLTLPTPNGLSGLKVNSGGNYTDETGQQWITDEIDLARGKYVQRTRKIVLDERTNIEYVGQHENGTKYLSIALQEKDFTLRRANMLCTRYIRAEWTNENGYVYSAKDDTIIITDNRFTDLEATKKIIGEEKPVIIYPLLTPIETDLPPETIAAFKKLHTNYPNTIITNNADAGMELTYTVDTQSYVDGKIAEINMQVVNTQKQLLQERSK